MVAQLVAMPRRREGPEASEQRETEGSDDDGDGHNYEDGEEEGIAVHSEPPFLGGNIVLPFWIEETGDLMRLNRHGAHRDTAIGGWRTMGEWIELRAADDQEIGAYAAWPEGEPVAALVVVQEIFGVND